MQKELIGNVIFEDVDTSDYPDFCDAHISSAEYNGEPMTNEQLDEVNQDRGFVYEQLMNYLY